MFRSSCWFVGLFFCFLGFLFAFVFSIKQVSCFSVVSSTLTLNDSGAEVMLFIACFQRAMWPMRWSQETLAVELMTR